MAPVQSLSTVGQSAQRVLAVTAKAWNIVPASPQAVARRAAHGHVPARVLRRQQAAARAPVERSGFLAHSW